MALMHRMKQLFNIMPRVCQSAARIKPWTHPFTVQRAAMSPTRPLNKFSWCFQVLNSTSKYWNQSSLVASWKAKEVLGRTSCSENKVKGYYKGTLSFSLHYAIELIEAGKTSNLGHKKRVAKKWFWNSFSHWNKTIHTRNMKISTLLHKCPDNVSTKFQIFWSFSSTSKTSKTKVFLGKTWNFQGLPIFETSNN